MRKMAPSARERDLPFSSRYSLPLHVSRGLGEVSWDTVAELSVDFQAKAEGKHERVRKVIKELQLARLLLMDRIRQGSQGGRIDPKLLVDVVRLLQRCEEVALEYDIDLKEFSSFLYLISEKLKGEKLSRHPGNSGMAGIVPIKEELEIYKEKSESRAKKGKRK